MEASMSSRSWRSVQLIVLVAIAAVAPGCPTNKQLAAPNIVGSSLADGQNIGRAPLIVFEFDREMDPTTIIASNFGFTLSGTTTPVTFTVEYNPTLFQVRIIPQTLLALGPPATVGGPPTAQSYDIWATANVTSSKGTAMGSAEGVTVTVPATALMATSITFPNPASTVGFGAITPTDLSNKTEIDVSWATNAQEYVNPTPITQISVPHYDVYVTTVQGQYDFLATTAPLYYTGSGSPIALTGLTSGTQYWIKVVPRDDEGNIYETPDELTATTNP
jgi:hypothetical protein